MQEEQIVQIPLKTILIKVIKSLPAKKPPLFDCSRVAPGSYQASVGIDVSGTKYSVDPRVTLAYVLGDVCPSPRLSQAKAV